MGVVHYSINFNPFYVFFKRHKCPNCNHKMTTSYSREIIPRKEAKPSQLSIGDISFMGDLEIRKLFFFCPCCYYKLSIDDMKKHEKKKKR